MPRGRGYRGANARSRAVAGRRGGGGIRVVKVGSALSGKAYRLARGGLARKRRKFGSY